MVIVSLVKRAFDVTVTLPMLVLLSPLLVVVVMLVGATSKGPIIYWSNRVGKNNQIFSMPKFRTMRTDTPQLPTHLLSNAASYLTPVGSFLRKTSLDELPQLWSILKGDLSIVGPRPALFNQDDLVALRTQRGIHRLTPGLTGWAQVNGRDELPDSVKVEYDHQYLKRQSLKFDLQIIGMTVVQVIRSEGIRH